MKDQPRKLLLLLVVLAIGSLTFGVNAATPALAAIAKAFPDVSPRLIKMVITIPSLLIMPSTLICGALSRVISKKKLLVVGMLLFAIGGLMPAFYFVISSDKIGNAGTASVAMTFSSVGGIAAGLILGWVTRLYRNYAFVFALTFLTAGSILLVFAHTAAMFMLACGIWGLGFGIFNSLIILQIMGSVVRSATAFALAILMSAMGIGQFISPIYYSYLNNLLGLQNPRAPWIVASACFVAALISAPAIIALKSRQRELPVAG